MSEKCWGNYKAWWVDFIPNTNIPKLIENPFCEWCNYTWECALKIAQILLQWENPKTPLQVIDPQKITKH